MSQFNLALICQKGEGVSQDCKKAIYWYEQSAKQGDASAQYNLALMYDNGEGVIQDYTKAVYWYEQSAKQGEARAQKTKTRKGR